MTAAEGSGEPPSRARAATAAAVRLIARGGRGSLLALALLIAAVWGVALVRGARPFDNSLEIWFLDDSPELAQLREFHATFGNDEAVVLSWREEGGALTPAALALVADVSSRVAALPQVEAVTSLATVLWTGVEPGPDGREEVKVERLFEGPPTAASAARAAARVRATPLLRGLLLSDDERATLVQVGPRRDADLDAIRGPLLDGVRQAADAAFRAAGREPAWSWGGAGVLNQALNEASARDSGVFTLASLLVIVVCLRLTLRRWRAVLLAVGAVASAAALLLGLYLALGHALNMVTMVLPSLVLVVGLTDSVYFVTTWIQEREALERAGVPRVDAVARIVGEAALPGLFNSVTSAVGFLSFLWAPMDVLRVFGLFAGLGIALAYLCSVVVVAAGLTVLDVRGRGAAPTAGGHRIDAFFLGVARLVRRRRKVVLAGSVVVLAVALLGIARLEFDSDPLRYFYPSHPVRQADARIAASFGPYLPFELVVDTGRADGVKEPAALRALEALGARTVAREAAVGRATSVADVVRHLHRVLADREGLPETLDMVEQELLLGYDPDRRDDPLKLVDWPPRSADAPGWRKARVTLRASSLGLKDGRALVGRIQADAAALLPPGATVAAAGYAPLYSALIDHLVWGQVSSIATTFLVIAGVLLVLFRSWRYALLSLPSNVVPVAATLGFMGFAGIDLDGATVLIAAIALGVAVDDTIHFLFKFRDLAEASRDDAAALTETLRTTGAAIATSSVVMALGFAVVGLASLKSVAYFGVLTAVTMVAALVSELLITPAVVLTFGAHRRRATA